MVGAAGVGTAVGDTVGEVEDRISADLVISAEASLGVEVLEEAFTAVAEVSAVSTVAAEALAAAEVVSADVNPH